MDFNISNISAGNYELKEQYVIYDGNVFLGDIGGYFGLLLGFSLFEVLKYLIDNCEGIIKWCQKVAPRKWLQTKIPSKTSTGGINQFPVREVF